MSNLETFRSTIKSYLLSNAQQPEHQAIITNIELCYSLIEHLCDKKLLHPNEVKIMKKNLTKRIFPITIPELQQIIMKEFGNPDNKVLLDDLLAIQKQIRQTKGILSIWKDKGLTKQEVTALNVLFARGNHRIKDICHILTKKKQLMQSVSEQQIKLIKSMDEWIIMQKIKKIYANFEDYQNINQKTIDGLFNQIRVRQVHFKAKKPSLKNIQQQSIVTVIGYNSKNDEAVQVTKIHKKCVDFDQMNQAMMTCNAHKDLLLSQYFLRFKGYNNNIDPEYFMYFREHVESRNLHYMVTNSTFQLQQSIPLYKFWAGEIFRALRDLNLMSSYSPILPIKLQDFCISDYGLRVILKNVKFDKIRQIDDNIEPQLLENLGHLLIELSLGTSSNIPQKFKNVQNMNLITALLRARQSYHHYELKIVPCYLNFFNVQTHPMFQSNQQTQGMQIINNFTVLYGQEC